MTQGIVGLFRSVAYLKWDLGFRFVGGFSGFDKRF